MVSPFGQRKVKSLAGQFIARLWSFRGITGELVRFTVCSMPFRYEDSLKMLLLKCYLNRYSEEMLQAHARYVYLEVNRILDVRDECYFNKELELLQAHARFKYLEVNCVFDVRDDGFRALLCPNTPTDLVHYNKGAIRRLVSLCHASCCLYFIFY